MDGQSLIQKIAILRSKGHSPFAGCPSCFYLCRRGLRLLLDRVIGVVAARGGLVLQRGLLATHLGRLKDRLRLDLLELGLEVLDALGLRRAVGAAARIRHCVVCVVFDFVSRAAPAVECGQNGRRARERLDLPVALSSAVLLCLVRIGIDGAGLREKLGDQALLLAFVVARVVTVAILVGSGHCRRYNVSFISFLDSDTVIDQAIGSR